MKKIVRALTWILSVFLFSFCKKEPATIPVLTTKTVTEITTTSAVASGEIKDDGGAPIISKGLCWKVNDSPTIDDNKTNEPGEKTLFTSKLSQLSPGTTYYIKAYATNSAGTGYGELVTFKTLGEKPYVNAINALIISGDSVTLNLYVDSKLFSTIVIIEWGLTIDYGNTITLPQSPVPADTRSHFQLILPGLTAGSTYHYRVKATNELGTSYSNDVEFKTPGFVPTVSNEEHTNITTNTATLKGSVCPGRATTDVVFEWGTTISYGNMTPASQSPITTDNCTSVSAILTDLIPGTSYHYRIKATNNLGTTTSPDKTFRTSGNAPTVEVRYPTDIHIRSAIINGYISSYNLPTTVIFEWGTTTGYGSSLPASQSPVNESLTSFVSALLTGLNPNTTYHYRIKATNMLGTEYSTDMSFMTGGSIPSVITKPVSAKINTAILQATVYPNSLPTTLTFEWGEWVVGNPIQYTHSGIPSISPVTSDSSVEVSFEITGLLAEKNYDCRIKVENELGTKYGYFSFRTFSVKDADNNFYRSTAIGTQTWLTENLKTTRYDNGDLIGTTTDPMKDISAESTSKYQWPAAGNENNVPVFGRLYTWYTVTDSRKLCPSGWHVPSNIEWSTLIEYIGGRAVGGRLKEYGTQYWRTPNDGAGGIGFGALPAESRTVTGYYGGLSDLAYFWTTTEYDVTEAWYWWLMYISTSIDNKKIDKRFGASVRCIKD